jgi:pimeloyl-[acyl-carrier protein] methyl ester esterase
LISDFRLSMGRSDGRAGTGFVKLVFLHGWGFDRSLWDGVRAELAPLESIVWDRGYFGSVRQESVEGPFIAVGHSLGSLLLAGDRPPLCAKLVAINGFDRFTGEGRIQPRVLERMISRLAVSPRVVLDEFRGRVGGEEHVGQIDAGRLRADLERLWTLDARGSLLPNLVLDGGKDELLPPSMREMSFTGAKRASLAEGGHLLPVSHPCWCADRIREVLA